MASKAEPGKKYLSHTLAEWACNLKFEHLSDKAVHTAKLFWYDSLGCALGGSQQEDARILLEHYREMAGERHEGTEARRHEGRDKAAGKSEFTDPSSLDHHSVPASLRASVPSTMPCTVFISGFKTNPVDAAFMNSHMVRAMDYNDIYWKADPCHPSDIICGPLALCEMMGLSGRDLIVGTIIAYEIEMRLCEAGIPGIREYGWHHATLTSFAAPLAAGRMLNLTVDQMVNAIGISAVRSFSPGASTAGKLTNMKNTVDPWATRMGVESALLARRGFSGPEHMIDGKEGLYAVFGHVHYKGQPARFDSSKLTDGLPKSKEDHYKIIDCGMKSFPIEALSHAPLTAMLKVVHEHQVKPDDVTEIHVEVISRAADILGDPAKYRPTTKETADHSLPYCLAVGLLDGMVTPLQFKQQRIDDPKLPAVMDKIKVIPNEEFDRLFPASQPSRVTIGTKDGRNLSARVDVPKGDPRDPMTSEEIGVKFNALGRDVVGEARCKQLGQLIMRLDELSTVDELMRLMTK